MMEYATAMLDWVDGTPLAQTMRTSLWLYPIVEIVHIVGFAVLVGAILLFDLRVLGASRSVSVQSLARHLLPWAIGSLLLIVPAGLLLFSAHPQEFISNPVFLIKLGLLVAAALNALLFHSGPGQSTHLWLVNTPAPARARMHALLSIMVWIAIISCGRLLAYT